MRKTLALISAIIVGTVTSHGQVTPETIVVQLRAVPLGANVTNDATGRFFNNNEAVGSQGAFGGGDYMGLLSVTWCHALIEDQGVITKGPRVNVGYITTLGFEFEGWMGFEWGSIFSFTVPPPTEDFLWQRVNLFEGQGPPSGLWLTWFGDTVHNYVKQAKGANPHQVVGDVGWVCAGTSAVFESRSDLDHWSWPGLFADVDDRWNSDDWELWVGPYGNPEDADATTALGFLNVNGICPEDTVFP